MSKYFRFPQSGDQSPATIDFTSTSLMSLTPMPPNPATSVPCVSSTTDLLLGSAVYTAPAPSRMSPCSNKLLSNPAEGTTPVQHATTAAAPPCGRDAPKPAAARVRKVLTTPQEITATETEDGQVCLGQGVSVAAGTWTHLMQQAGDAAFCKQLAVALWGNETLAERSLSPAKVDSMSSLTHSSGINLEGA
ncbi:uncharacterized protein LOC135378550 isoform X2 [Ornithodoros turicata]|uniref:uncharacterized protein LOC135378550 isoform X2 n=1 Tax=Ornithodoros turicata TaxID=34597 RepID=UPI0031392963